MAKRRISKATGVVGRGQGQPGAAGRGVSTDLSGSPYQLQAISVQFGTSLGIVQGAPQDWFGPLNPPAPAAPAAVAGRQFDYLSGFNLSQRPRSYEPIGFPDLRALAESYDVLRLVIETRKDQLERLTWTIRPKEEQAASADDSRIPEILKFFERPDGEHPWGAWLRMVLEDLFVIDAPTLYRQRTRGGQLAALQVLDGATIKRVIDDWGRTPQPWIDVDGTIVIPPAYQQQLKGLPAVNYSARELLYLPRNIRPHKVYGYGPVEQIITTVNIALRRQITQLQTFTEGNIPEALIGVPDAWTPDQIVAFQAAWDLMMEGNLAQKRHAKFVPGGIAKGYTPTREPELKNPFDEWLARIVCFAFSISPQPFVQMMNRATAGTAKETADEEGIEPQKLWVKRMIDRVLADDFGAPDLEFAFETETVVDVEKETQRLTKLQENGALTLDEVREATGKDPFRIKGVSDVPLVKSTVGWKALDAEGVKNNPPPDPSADPFGGPGKPSGNVENPDREDGGKNPQPKPTAKAAGSGGRIIAALDGDRAEAIAARAAIAAKAETIFKATMAKVKKQLPGALAADAAHHHPD